MGIQAAVAAYRQSAYQRTEYDIETSVGKASIPIIGGFFGSLKQLGNALWRPLKVLGALTFGGEYPVDNITPAKIPDDIRNTKYAEALTKLREFAHQSADMRAEAWGHFLSGRWGTAFRLRRAARYAENQNRMVVLPDEGRNIVDAGLGAGTAVGAVLLSRTMSSSTDPMSSLGNLASSIGQTSVPNEMIQAMAKGILRS